MAMGMGYNPNFYARNYNQEINALQNQIDKLRGLNNQIQSPIASQPQPPANGITQIGTYVVVKTVQDMENYPVPVDGTPVNVFVDNMGVFYSKKMSNGVVSCQPFSFAPLNGAKNDEKTADEITTENVPIWAENVLSRLSSLEEKINARTQKQSEKKNQGEVDINGI